MFYDEKRSTSGEPPDQSDGLRSFFHRHTRSRLVQQYDFGSESQGDCEFERTLLRVRELPSKDTGAVRQIYVDKQFMNIVCDLTLGCGRAPEAEAYAAMCHDAQANRLEDCEPGEKAG